MTDATLPESTNSPAASLTSEPEKLLPVIQADRDAAADHGRAFYRLTTKEADAVRAGKWDDERDVQWFARHRLSSPVSGTDTTQAHNHARSGDYRMAYLKMCEAYGKRTPATLDNTAVEGRISVNVAVSAIASYCRSRRREGREPLFSHIPDVLHDAAKTEKAE